MEIIGVILFIIFMVVSASDSKKKRQARGAALKPPSGTPEKPVATLPRESGDKPLEAAQAAARDFDDALAQMRQKLEDAGGAARRSEPVLQAMAARGAAEGRPMLNDEECRGGSMEHVHTEGHAGLDDEDCFGGSMEHTHTEGVSRAAHARRMTAIDAHDGGTADEALLPRTVDALALRRAVVMAEVLGKPRALRARR